MLDALPLRALDRDGQARVDAHLAGCTRCREELERAAELRRHFTAHVQPAGLPARPRRWWWLMVPAVASVLLIVAIGPWQQPAPSAPPARLDEAGLGELGIKGDASWLVFANRAGRVLPVHDGTELEAGDRIRFMVIPGAARYLMVASIDGRGAATIYFPYGGSQSAAIDGDRVEPEGSIVLDAAPGPERIFALLSDAPIAAETVRAQLREIARGGSGAIRGTVALALPVRAQASLVFEKAAPCCAP